MGSGASKKKTKEDKYELERKELLKKRKVTSDILEILARGLPKATNSLGACLQ